MSASERGAPITPNPVPRDERITAAALELLRTKGPRAVTVEAVAARADVAKTTIYRRYRDRQDMLAAALTSLTQPPHDTTAAAPNLKWLIDQCHDAIEQGIGLGGVAALLTDEDPAFTTSIRSLLAEHRQALADVLQQKSTGKQIRRDLDVDTVLDCIVGAYLAERARRGPVKPGWADRILHTLSPALTTSRAAKH